MALQLTLVLDNGVTITDAYHKIVQLTVNARGTSCNAYLEVHTYVNSTKADIAQQVIVRTYLMPSFDKTNDAVTAAGQAYNYLKTLDDFNGALDV